MFKKNVSTVQTSLLSGKDVKSLKRDIKLNFPDLEEHEISDLIPNKSEVSLLKLSNRAQAYTCNGKNPLFFDPEVKLWCQLLLVTCVKVPLLLDNVLACRLMSTLAVLPAGSRRPARADRICAVALSPYPADAHNLLRSVSKGIALCRSPCSGMPELRPSTLRLPVVASQQHSAGCPGAWRCRLVLAGPHRAPRRPGQLHCWGFALNSSPRQQVPLRSRLA